MPDIKYALDGMTFNWNEIEAKINKKKRGITFEETATSFKNINRIIIDRGLKGLEKDSLTPEEMKDYGRPQNDDRLLMTLSNI